MKKKFELLALLPFLCILSAASAQVAPPTYQWSKGIGGFFDDVGYSITTDNNGNIITAGVFTELVNFNEGGTNPAIKYGAAGDGFVSKHDSLGNLIWVQQFGGEGQDGAVGAVADNHGNVYVTGYFSGTADLDPGITTQWATSTSGTDIFMAKLNANGDFIWAKHLEGGGDYGRPEKMVLQPLGASFYLAGSFSDTLDFDPNAGVSNLITEPFITTGFIARYTENGELVWAKQLEGVDYGIGVNVGIDGNVFLTGIFSDTATFDLGQTEIQLVSQGQSDIYVAKFKADGELLWAKGFGDVNSDWGYGIANDLEGNVLVTGMFNGSIDFDPGVNNETLTSRFWDAFVLKLNDEGEYVWAKSFGGELYEWGNAITTDSEGSVYTTGWFNDTADFDPGPSVFELTAGAFNEIFIQKLDANGNFVWAGQLKGSQIFDASNNQGYSITVDNNFNIYTTGQFETFMDCDPGPLVDNVIALDEQGGGFYRTDFFIHKLSQASSVGIDNTTQTNVFKYFPNPTEGLLNITFNELLSNVEAEIIDVSGKTVLLQSFNNCNNIQIPLNIESGLYFVRLKNKNEVIGNFKISKV